MVLQFTPSVKQDYEVLIKVLHADMTSFLSEHQELFDADYVCCLTSAKMVAGPLVS